MYLNSTSVYKRVKYLKIVKVKIYVPCQKTKPDLSDSKTIFFEIQCIKL